MILHMISICILTKNAAATLQATLESTRDFDEVILLDNGSTDETLAIAARFPNVKIHTTPFIGFGPLRNLAASKASHDWILALDSDEILSPSLIQEIRGLQLDPQCGYFLRRHNYYNGKRIFGCGWDPEYTARLYHRGHSRFADVEVHEALIAPKWCKLTSPLLHTPFRTTSDFLMKMQTYSTLFAKQNQDRRKSSLTRALSHGFFAFIRSYLLRRGFLCGKEGFIISLYNANTTFYKYLKLSEINQKK